MSLLYTLSDGSKQERAMKKFHEKILASRWEGSIDEARPR